MRDDAEAKRRIAAFVQGLEELGWTQGQNIQLEYRYGGGDAERMRAFAAELVAIAPDVILANGAGPATALRAQTRTLPIVFQAVPDPIGLGLVTNLARPEGNITGFSSIEPTMGGKLVETLREITPTVARVSVIFNPGTASYHAILAATESAARSFAIEPTPAPVRNPAEIENAITAAAEKTSGALIVLPDAFTATHRELITSLALRHRLPSVYPYSFFVTSGGLVSYGIDINDAIKQAATYIDRILQGVRPSDLPVQQPRKFELVVSQKTAKALGLTIPASLLARADEVIE
jgi:putative ABC transport system substrate-binding protein